MVETEAAPELSPPIAVKLQDENVIHKESNTETVNTRPCLVSNIILPASQSAVFSWDSVVSQLFKS